MAKQLFTNNATSTLSGTLAQGGATLICASGEGSNFPAPTGSDFFLLTIFERDLSSNEEFIEVVKVTARTADTMTIERDIESMTGNAGGYAYPSVPAKTVYLELRWTALGAGNLLQESDTGTPTTKGKELIVAADAAAVRTAAGLGDAATKNVGTGAGTVAAGDHAHGGVYEPADATILKDADIGVTVQAYDADTAKLDVEQTWTAQQTPKNGTLTDGATIDWNGDTNGQSVKVTLGGNRTMNAPTNINESAAYVLRAVQDATGSRTLAWNSTYKFPNGVAPTLSTAANAVDVFTFIGGASNVLYCVGQAMDVK